MAGVYQINAGIRWDPFSVNTNFVIINVVAGGIAVQDDRYGRAGENPNTTVSFARKLNVGDQVRVEVYQGSGVNQSISAGYNANHFSVQYLHN